jgi:hypothetical protein
LPGTQVVLNTLLLILIAGLIGGGILLGSELEGRIDRLDESQARIVRWYEDGSGRIKLSNGYCTFPAFDSPEDKVVCHKE